MRVTIVEDHALLAQSLAVALAGEGLDAHVANGTETAAVVDEVLAHDTDIVLLDLDLGEPLGSGRDLIEPLRLAGAQVIVLTGTTDATDHAEAIEAGANGVLTKQRPFDEVVSRVRAAADGEVLVPPQQRTAMLSELARQREADQRRLRAFDALTPREAAVLEALMDGWPAERMAREWYVSITTVRSQIRAVLQKLDVNSQLAAVALARRCSWKPGQSGAR